MSTLKSILFPIMAFIWLGAALTYPLYSDLLRKPATSVQSTPVAAQTVAVEAKTETKPAKTIISGKPRHISVPSLGINVGINDGFYDEQTKQWSLSEEAAFYATPTPVINNESGSTFIYGHNSKKIFGKLLKIDSPTEVIVTTDTGYEFIYDYKDRETVDPNDTSVLAYSGKPRIMLQTCTGIWNENREMFYFYLREHRKV